MSVELYQRVALRQDLPQHGLRQGDVATLVDRVESPSGGEHGYVLEVFNAVGDSLCVVTVKASEVEPLHQDEMLAVRRNVARAG